MNNTSAIQAQLEKSSSVNLTADSNHNSFMEHFSILEAKFDTLLEMVTNHDCLSTGQSGCTSKACFKSKFNL